ncbi:hypothetical protein T492DRAFT_1028162, partial [Pavlovales sp. CCMP2436]
MLYDLTCGDVSEWEVAPRFDELLAGTGIEHVRADLTAVDTAARTISIKGAEGKQTLAYDNLILSLGSQPVSPPAKGVLSYRTLDDALFLRFKLRALLASGAPLVRVVVVGASYSGIELASNLAKTLGPRRGLVTLVGRGDKLLQVGALGNQQAAAQALERAGVEVILGKDVELEGPSRAKLTPAGSLSDGFAEFVDADLVIWCAGSARAKMASDLKLAVAMDGRVATTSSLAVRDTEGVFAIGDMACCEPLGDSTANAQNAQVAVQQAEYAAYNVWASRNGKAPMPYRYLKAGEMLAFGPTDASV